MKRFLQILLHERSLLGNNTDILTVFLLAPLVYALLMGEVYRQGALYDVPVAVLDLDDSPLSAQLVEALDEHEYVRVAHTALRREEVMPLLMGGTEGLVVIPKGFEADVQQKRVPEVAVELNGSNLSAANYANIGIVTVLETYNAGIEMAALQKQGVPPSVARQQYQAFSVDSERYFNPTNSFLRYVWPGMLGVVLQQIFLLAVALSLAAENEGTGLGHLAGISRNPLFTLNAKLSVYWVGGLLYWAALRAVLFPFYDFPPLAHPLALLALTGLFVLGTTYLGALFSMLCPTMLSATQLGMALSMPTFILSGFTWPLHAMPQPLQQLAQAIPLTHLLSGIRKVVMQGATLQELMPELQALGLLALLAALGAHLALGFRFRKLHPERLDIPQ